MEIGTSEVGEETRASPGGIQKDSTWRARRGDRDSLNEWGSGGRMGVDVQSMLD